MKEIKTPRKPLFMYYIIAMVVLMLLNTFLFPSLMKPTVTEVPYSEFLAMLADGKVDAVEMEQNRILFRDKQPTPAIYETGLMDDPGLVARLQEAKVAFGAPIIQQASPLVSFLISWILPIGIFVVLAGIVLLLLVKKGILKTASLPEDTVGRRKGAAGG